MILGLSAAFGVAACGPGEAPAAVEMVASVEAEALAAMGVDPADIVQAEFLASPSPDKGDKKLDKWKQRRFAKVALHRNTLHGEAVVQTKDGKTITVLVQRGVVTALDDKSVTVKSSDGYTMTWTFAENMRVVEKRTSIKPGEIKVGSELALAGAKEGDSAQARLIVVPLAKR
jgi:hypothetical protein